jgi:hypothetical protein
MVANTTLATSLTCLIYELSCSSDRPQRRAVTPSVALAETRSPKATIAMLQGCDSMATAIRRAAIATTQCLANSASASADAQARPGSVS